MKSNGDMLHWKLEWFTPDPENQSVVIFRLFGHYTQLTRVITVAIRME